MANDLLIMSCKHCRGWTTLAKYYPSSGLRGMSSTMFMSEFIDRHIQCSWQHILDAGGLDLSGDTQFELHTEEAFEKGGVLMGRDNNGRVGLVKA